MLAIAIAVALLPAPADATVIWSPRLEISGEPTPDEVATIQRAWSHLTEAFPSTKSCMEPVTVQVVDRVEDHYSTQISFSIAAFYRYPPSSTVFIEHGKVRPAVILHEFAHHMDVSCGFGRSHFGAEFMTEEGFGPGHDWITGTAWSAVPAERFAEGVLIHLGVDDVEIDVGQAAVAMIAQWAVVDRDGPVEIAPGFIAV